MKFELLNQEEEAVATSLQGYVTSTRKDLTLILGEPNQVESLDGKTSVEWVIKFDDKTIATIYDWKRYELGTPEENEVYDWHIGGHGPQAVTAVLGIVNESRQMKW